MSQLTTHILDTSRGCPAAGVSVSLYQQHGEQWKQLTTRLTNQDGRIPDLIEAGVSLKAGVYKLYFATKEYFEKQEVASFYPFVEIVFYITDNSHYHVPLLLNPFGYSTYRGS